MLLGLLLGHAVERPQAEDQVAAGYAYHFAIWEEAGQGVESYAIVRVVEGGDDDESVGDVKVCVARGEALAFEINGGGHRQGFDAKRAAVVVFHLLEQGQIFCRGGSPARTQVRDRELPFVARYLQR